MEKIREKKLSNIFFLASCALMSALLCVVSPMSIPIGEVPISLATFIIYVSVWVLGPYGASLSVMVYLFLGIVGLPVFSGGAGGVGKLAGPTGGYLAGYIILAFVSGLFLKFSKKNVVITIIGMIFATALLYAFGTAWFMIQIGAKLGHALKICVIPFIPFDLIKIGLSAVVGKPASKGLSKAGLDFE